jgi:predicted alpha/beta superfamily hydrolase
MNLVALLFSAATLLAVQSEVVAESRGAAAITEAGHEFRLFQSQHFDLKSALNGRVYRIMIGVPKRVAPMVPAPTLYVLDGGQYFETAATAAARYASSGEIVSPVVVGIGYATDDLSEIVEERALDLTPTVPLDPTFVGKYGGGPAFAQVLESEIVPFVRSRFAPDVQHQAIWGHSHGGLFVIANLLKKDPTRFSH